MTETRDGQEVAGCLPVNNRYIVSGDPCVGLIELIHTIIDASRVSRYSSNENNAPTPMPIKRGWFLHASGSLSEGGTESAFRGIGCERPFSEKAAHIVQTAGFSFFLGSLLGISLTRIWAFESLGAGKARAGQIFSTLKLELFVLMIFLRFLFSLLEGIEKLNVNDFKVDLLYFRFSRILVFKNDSEKFWNFSQQ